MEGHRWKAIVAKFLIVLACVPALARAQGFPDQGFDDGLPVVSTDDYLPNEGTSVNPLMKIFSICILWMVGVLVAGAASAVTLSTSGSGQVLIYPYYTVNAGQQSTLTLSNSDQAKAVKLMVRGGAFGRLIYVLNVYLGPYDTWTATLGKLESKAYTGPVLVSNDTTCTVPSLHAESLPTSPSGRRYLLPNAGVLPANSVAAEGYIVAIEMGVLGGESAQALALAGFESNPDRGPTDCAKLIAAWQEGGYWRSDASTDVTAPSGGLTGSMTILNAGEGTVFRVGAVGLKDFRVAAMHTAPEATEPNLGDGLSNADSGVASATIRLGDKIIHSNYPADRAIDAVTAVLMAQKLTTNFDFRPWIGARTDFVFTMPTKRFYVADADHILAPFGRDRDKMTSPLGTVCPVIGYKAHNRSGTDAELWFHYDFGWHPFLSDAPKPCYATSVIGLDRTVRPLGLLGSELMSQKSLNDDDTLGHVQFNMDYALTVCAVADCSNYYKSHMSYLNLMRPDLEGRQYLGLPAIGFAATGQINAYAGEKNVWRNFTFSSPYGRERACMQGGVVGGCH